MASLIFNGGLYEHYRYSAFGGRKIFDIHSNTISVSQINNPWQFSSKRMDEETGLIYYGRRYYDPKLGRWITCDPKGFVDGLNLYAFVMNDPLIKVDLYGLEINFQNSWIYNAMAGAVHSVAGFGAQSINVVSDIGFGISTPFLYGYRSLTGGNFNQDWQTHQQQKANFRMGTQNFMHGIMPANQSSRAYQISHSTTTSVLDGMALGSSIGGLYRMGGAIVCKTVNALERATLMGESIAAESRAVMMQTKEFNGGLNVERLVKDVKIFKPKVSTKPLGLGSTGRTVAKTLKERAAMAKVMQNPEIGKELLRVPMTDKRWHMKYGWVKVARNIDGVEIHWVRNKITGAVDDFKFKN